VERPTRVRALTRGRRRVLAVVVAVAALAAPAAWFATAAQPDATRVVVSATGAPRLVSFSDGGRQRSYRLFVPPQVAGTRHPLLVALHPLYGTALKFEQMSGLDERAAAAGAVVVYPEGLGHSWDAGTCCSYAVRHHVDDVQFVTRVVADVQRRLPIDPARIAVTGFSNGALMSYRLACERSDLFHVVVAVAGDAVGPRCNPAFPVALLHVHGARDGLIPLSGVASSELDPEGFPPAAASVERIAVADDCSGAATGALPYGADWSATGCTGNLTVELLTLTHMGHHYPSGSADLARYGVDMSALTWSFVQAAWGAA
jgi:polyhydroxybutyrate depolymerase